MKVSIQSTLECSAEKAIMAVTTSKLMLTVCKPLVRFVPIRPNILPETWGPGDYTVKIYLFGIIPFGKHTIRISFPKPNSQNLFQLRDSGGGQVAPTWDHLITIQSISSTWTLYKDDVEIKAGIITFFVWIFAQYYYWHRQRRWKRLVKNNFDYNAL